jgi:hypothetical protein
VSSTTTPDPVTAERNINPRFWMDERTVDTLSQKLTVPRFNEVPDENINNTTHAINLDDTSHPSSTLVNWIISGIWF